MLTPQLILRMLGIAALVVAALFAVLAVHYYLTNNIRAVMDDLSGKARAQGVARTQRRSAKAGEGKRSQARRPARSKTQAGQAATAPASVAPEMDLPQMVVVDDEGPGTQLVAAAVPQQMPAPQPVAPKQAGATPAPATFRVTRRVVLIHSQEVIAASEEL